MPDSRTGIRHGIAQIAAAARSGLCPVLGTGSVTVGNVLAHIVAEGRKRFHRNYLLIALRTETPGAVPSFRTSRRFGFILHYFMGSFFAVAFSADNAYRSFRTGGFSARMPGAFKGNRLDGFRTNVTFEDLPAVFGTADGYFFFQYQTVPRRRQNFDFLVAAIPTRSFL